MAKKKLSTEQKMKQFKRKRRVKIALEIIIPIIAVALLIPACYYGYYYVVFNAMATRDSDQFKGDGAGYSHPLHLLTETEMDGDLTLAYYHGGCWHVVDDSESLRKNRDHFILYKRDNDWHQGTHLQLFVIRNNEVHNHIPLSDFTLIDDRCFDGCMKLMSMEEFEQYHSARRIRKLTMY